MNRVNKILYHSLYRSTLQEIEVFEKDRAFCLHNIEHFFNVARLMYILALEQNIAIEKDILYATALLHDIGRANQYKTQKPHAIESASIARSILSACDYTSAEIEQICHAIASHNQIGQETLLSSMLKQADKQSRNCFLCHAYKDCYWPEEQKNKGVSS